jgi:hypothetical protein
MDDALSAALTQASEELGLQEWYRSCVKPLLAQPREQWPTCCGGVCEPCNGRLVMVAERTLELVSTREPDSG